MILLHDYQISYRENGSSKTFVGSAKIDFDDRSAIDQFDKLLDTLINPTQLNPSIVYSTETEALEKLLELQVSMAPGELSDGNYDIELFKDFTETSIRKYIVALEHLLREIEKFLLEKKDLLNARSSSGEDNKTSS